MKITGNRVLIEQNPSAGQTAGGIFIPESAQQVGQEGIVAAIGSGITESREYKKGSYVFIEMYKAKSTIKHNDKDYFLVEKDDICGVMVDGKFHPVGDRILLQPIKTVARGGVIVRPSAYDDDKGVPIHCIVRALGSGMRLKDKSVIPFDVAIGDEVVVESFCGRDVDVPAEVLKLVRQTDILCVIEKHNVIEQNLATKSCQTN